MEYPIMVDGKSAGNVQVFQDGLFTVFEAKCAAKAELMRLSVYGGGQEGYLGVMQPGQNGLYLRRRLSRSQLKSFPEKIEFAAPAGMEQVKAADAPSGRTAEKKEKKGLCWHRYSDGSLVCRDGSGFIIALPARPGRYARAAVLKEIEGQLYMLFRY